MNERNPITTTESWVEWKKACTIGNCSDETARRLARFAQVRLGREFQKRSEAGLAGEFAEEGSPKAWLELEKHLYAGKKRDQNIEGKRYKDQLFKVCSGTRADFESVMTRIIQRDVLRKILHEEKPDKWNASGKRQLDDGVPRVTASLDAPLGPEGSASLYERLASEKYDGVESLALEPATDEDDKKVSVFVSDELVGKWWAELDDRNKKLLACLLAGKKTTEIAKSGCFDCQKSQLYEGSNQLMEKLKKIDWGMGVNDRTNAFLTGVFLIRLKGLTMDFLNEPENHGLRCFISGEAGSSHE